MEELKPQTKPEIKPITQEPWIEAALQGGKITQEDLDVYKYVFSEHMKAIPFLHGDADQRQMDDRAFLRRIYSQASKEFGVSEKEAETIFYRLEILRVNYRPPVQNDFSPEAIERNMPRYLEYYRECRNTLIQAAAMNRNYAVSYRPKPFRVGAAILSLDSDLPDDQPAIHPGANFTPVKGDYKGSDKRCAERHAVEGAIAYNTKLIIAIVIVSEEKDKGDDENKPSETLHPCLECRKMYRDLLKKGILREDSIICSVNDSELDENGMPSVIQEMTVKELLELYKDDPE
jgi:cytidine deaminase